MARTGFATTHALRLERQSAAFFLYMQPNTFFGKFIGPMDPGAQKNDSADGAVMSGSPNALIQLKMDFTKQKGDIITFPMQAPLTSAGVVGDNDLEGNEESMTFYDWQMTLFQIAHAVRGEGALSERRVIFDVRQRAKIALSEWMGRKIDHYALRTLSGLASDDANIAAVAPSTNRRWVGGQTAAGVLSKTANNRLSELDETNHLFGPRVIEAIKRKAMMATPKIRPIRDGGEDHYLHFLHPYQVKSLKATTEWPDIQKNAGLRGPKNPMFTGALGMWDNVWLHSWERIERRLGAGTATAAEIFDAADASYPLTSGVDAARSLFCGAQAAAIAWGIMPQPVTEEFDYKRKWGVGVTAMLAVGKPKFNSEDYGVICVDTAIVPD